MVVLLSCDVIHVLLRVMVVVLKLSVFLKRIIW
jgi:hypothetical protein